MPVETLKWDQGRLTIVDQTLLPTQFNIVSLDTLKHVWNAIKTLQIRGAPAIGHARRESQDQPVTRHR